MAAISDETLERLLQAADYSQVKLQMTAGMPTWEAVPGVRHQRLILGVWNSIRRKPQAESDWGCHAVVDVYVRFPDGSFLSPDVAIYGQELPDVDGATDVIPVAVIKIVSAGYEEKDRIGLPFYLAQGIVDVVLYDPRAREVIHATPQEQTVYSAPVELTFACGCTATIPL